MTIGEIRPPTQIIGLKKWTSWMSMPLRSVRFPVPFWGKRVSYQDSLQCFFQHGGMLAIVGYEPPMAG